MVFQAVYDEIRRTHPEQENEVLVVGIGGNTGSGKSSFTREFSGFLLGKGVRALPWGNDFYRGARTEKIKRREELIDGGADKRDDWWKVFGESVYYDTYNRELLDEHLTALRERQDIPIQNFYDSTSGEYDRKRGHSFDGYQGPFWVLHDGVYLFHPKVRPHLDRLILLTTGEETLVSDSKLGEISEERKVRFDRVARRAREEREYEVTYTTFLPLDIHTAKHIRDGLSGEDDIILVDNADYNNRIMVSQPQQLP